MRFIPGGPDIPEELIIARDKGDVVFFCGAGISQQAAFLPNFNSLAQQVIDKLGSAKQSPARQLFETAKSIADAPDSTIPGIGSLIATDRIFGLLEREFWPHDVRRAVIDALQPPEGYRLDAHRTIIDLATDRTGVVRLVTTNFDKLFQECRADLRQHIPPHLPNPLDEREFRGIVHLHGCIDAHASDDEFVISSADFGRAYLSDGWATQFMRKLLSRFCVVFVGFTADDPPIQYLLEALHLKSSGASRLYAFHNGCPNHATELWQHRGVTAISCDSFDSMWGSLDSWADRARDEEGWYGSLLKTAEQGPEQLDRAQRSMIIKLLSTTEGARMFATSEIPPDARWLLVADPAQRYAAPSFMVPHDDATERVDPFERLSLDDDPPPPPSWEAPNPFVQRDPNPSAFDAFALTDAERVKPETSAQLRGHTTVQNKPLSERLADIGMWIARIAHQPITLWWAAHQSSLHPDIVTLIERQIRSSPANAPEAVRKGWFTLFAAWADRRDDPSMLMYKIREQAARDGWSYSLVRELAGLYRPRLTTSFAIGPHPLFWNEDTSERLLHATVCYPRPHETTPVPPEFVAYAVCQFRANLDLAFALENEFSGKLPTELYLQTTRADDDGPALSEDSFQLTGSIVQFQNLMSRLVAIDLDAARAQRSEWPLQGSVIYERLNIWAAAQRDLTTAREAAAIFSGLDDEAFWSSRHRRDLLYALRDRWAELDAGDREQIEIRLRTTSLAWANNTPGGADSARAFFRLNHLHWLNSRNVRFSFDVEAEIAELRLKAPDWRPEAADQAAESDAPTVRWLGTNDASDGLESAPIADIPKIAREMQADHFFAIERRRPFSGLAASHPNRAYLALVCAFHRGEFDPALWAQFLMSNARATDSARFHRTLAARLLRLSDDNFREVNDPVSRWMRTTAQSFFAASHDLFQPLWDRSVASLETSDTEGAADRRDLPFEALNSTLGRLFEIHMEDPAKLGLAPGAGFPRNWLKRLEQLLATLGGLRQQAIVRIAFQTSWLYHIDPTWTDTALLGYADAENVDSDAFWEGYFWGGQSGMRDLRVRLKKSFIKWVSQSRYKETYTEIAASILLLGWRGDEKDDPVFSDDDVRNALIAANDDFRLKVIRILERSHAEVGSSWGDTVVRFLEDAWPKQRAVYTASVSAGLAEFAVVSGERMPAIVALIVPRIVAGHGGILHSFFWNSEQPDHPARVYPQATLDLLWAVLDQSSPRPHKIEDVLDILAQASTISMDPRLAELRRRYRR